MPWLLTIDSATALKQRLARSVFCKHFAKGDYMQPAPRSLWGSARRGFDSFRLDRVLMAATDRRSLFRVICVGRVGPEYAETLRHAHSREIIAPD